MEPTTYLPDGTSREHTVIDLDGMLTHSDQGNLDFYDSTECSAGNTNIDVSGTLTAKTDSTYYHQRNTPIYYVTRFLENQGFGWLLENDDQTVDFQKPLLEDLDIDLTDIYYKVLCVLLPFPYFRLKLSIVRESPDFWGPLFIVSAFALLSLYGQLSVLSWIMTIWFIGAFFVFFLARALGGEVGYGQVLGIVGYCLIPLVIVGLLIPFLSRFRLLSVALGCFGVLWSVYSAGVLLCVEELREKRALLLYPVFLLYVYFFSLYTGV